MGKEVYFKAGKNSLRVRKRLLNYFFNNYNVTFKTVADIGAGDLQTATLLHHGGCKVTAYDIAKQQNKFIKSKHIDLNKNWNIRKRFDYVISTAVIEHCENPYFFMRQAYKITKNRGICIISTHDIDYHWSKILFMFQNYFYGFHPVIDNLKHGYHGHINPMNEGLLKVAGQKAGFKVIDVFFANPNLKLLPFIKPFDNVPNWKYLSQDVFVVFKKQ